MKLNLNNADLKITAGLIKQFPADRIPQAAFAGKSNVGKSSLINSLLNRKNLARVSGEPGKTITVNFFDVDKSSTLSICPVTATRSARLRIKRDGPLSPTAISHRTAPLIPSASSASSSIRGQVRQTTTAICCISSARAASRTFSSPQRPTS